MFHARELLRGAENESRIVWVDPRWRDYPYVREKAFLSRRLTGAPKKSLIKRVVGYAELRPGTGNVFCNRLIERRVWMLHTDDFEPTSEGGRNAYTNVAGLIDRCPVEGVTPESVRPGTRSVAAISDLMSSPRRIPPPSFDAKPYERIIGDARVAVAIAPVVQEKPSRSYVSSYLIEGQAFQMRAARLDAALRAVRRAQLECYSVEREVSRGGSGPSPEEISAARINAAAETYARWWPTELARQLAEADFGPRDTDAYNQHLKKHIAWLERKMPRVR
jgi:hypothetical protein